MMVIYEDDDVLVIHKPAGVPVDEISSLFPHAYLVHRLDRETSGVMILAKTECAAAHLREQFKSRTVEKRYVAVVRGRVKQNAGTIDKPISKGRRDFRKFTTRASGRGARREAVTRYHVRERFGNVTLLDVYPKTGRTHQIRVHLAAIGHPVVGDKRYGASAGDAPRHMLHAASLTLTLPSGSRATFDADLPKDFEDCVARAGMVT